MCPGHGDELTQILGDLQGTDRGDAAAAILPEVYAELRSLSEAYLRSERSDHTLQATALVHEAYVRLARSKGSGWQNRVHFFRAAAKTMRRILINHARGQNAVKRGGGERPVALEEATVALPERDVDLVALDEALNDLAALDPQKARVVELRFFGGCSIEQTAETLGVSAATVVRDWRFARAWLQDALEPSDDWEKPNFTE